MSDTLSPTATAVLECLTACDRPMTRAEIYKADDTIESEEAVSHALIELRTADRIKRRKSGAWTLIPRDESAPEPAPAKRTEAMDSPAGPRTKAQRVIDYVNAHGPVTSQQVKQALDDKYAPTRLLQAATGSLPRLHRERDGNNEWQYWPWHNTASEPTPESAPDTAETEQPAEPSEEKPAETDAPPITAEPDGGGQRHTPLTHCHLRDVALWASGQLVIAGEIDGNDEYIALSPDDARRLLRYLDRIAEPT